MRDYQIANKIRAIRIKGSSCNECGLFLEDKPWVADFHHINDKNFKPSALFKRKWEHIEIEIGKTTLLCGNCHSKEHHDIDRYNALYHKILDMSKKELSKKYKPKNVKSIILEMFNNGCSINKIAKDINISISTVYYHLKSAGINTNANTNKFSKEMINHMIESYNQGESVKSISIRLGINWSNIYRIIRNEKKN